MDDGVVALVAAGIGVGGVVVASAMGWRGARMTASAQVEAALAGVREQAKLEQGVALMAAPGPVPLQGPEDAGRSPWPRNVQDEDA